MLVLAAVSPYLAYTDARWRRLPNRTLAVAATVVVVGLAAAGLATGRAWPAARALACGAIAVTVAGAAAIASRGFGGGDAKLIGLIGLSLGANGWAYPTSAVFLGFVAAGLWAVGVLAARPRHRQRAIPLGPFLTASAMLIVCLPTA